MKRFQLCMLSVVVLFLMVSSGSAQSGQNKQNQGKSSQAASANSGKSSLEETIISMERRAWEAVKARDTKTFSELFAADGLLVDAGGMTTRPAFFQSLPDLTITDYKLSDLKVTMIDKNTALITYRADSKGSFKGQPFPPNPAYTSTIWTKRGGKWVAIYHQETMSQ